MRRSSRCLSLDYHSTSRTNSIHTIIQVLLICSSRVTLLPILNGRQMMMLTNYFLAQNFFFLDDQLSQSLIVMTIYLTPSLTCISIFHMQIQTSIPQDLYIYTTRNQAFCKEINSSLDANISSQKFFAEKISIRHQVLANKQSPYVF